MRLGARLALKLSISGFLLAHPQLAFAGDEISPSADATVSTGYSRNPFSSTGNDPSSGYVQINARPAVTLTGEHNVISLVGLFSLEHYFRLYPDTNSYGATLNYSGTPSARLTTHANVHYDSSIVGAYQANNPALTAPTTGTDLSLFGTRSRRRSLTATGDATYVLSARDSLTANGFYDVVRYGGQATQAAQANLALLTNYDGYGGGAGYARRLSGALQIGVQASTARYIYQGLLGNSDIYTLQATVNDQISSQWSLAAALGGSRASRTIGGTSTAGTGSLTLCQLGPRHRLCLLAQDALLPTSTLGTINTKSINVNYTYNLSERSNVSASGAYSRNGQSAVTRSFVQNTYVTASANYDRTLRPRIHLMVTTQYRKVMGGASNRPDDFGGSVGISVRFGEYR